MLQTALRRRDKCTSRSHPTGVSTSLQRLPPSGACPGQRLHRGHGSSVARSIVEGGEASGAPSPSGESTHLERPLLEVRPLLSALSHRPQQEPSFSFTAPPLGEGGASPSRCEVLTPKDLKSTVVSGWSESLAMGNWPQGHQAPTGLGLIHRGVRRGT